MNSQTENNSGFYWDELNPRNGYLYSGDKVWYLTGIKDFRIEGPDIEQLPETGLITVSLSFNYDFTENGKPNDNAPDSVRPDLHTDGKG